MIRRLESIDPKIKAGQSIPLSRVTEAFDKMRGQGGDRGRDDDRNRSSNDDESDMLELLVPGFGIDEPVIGVPGFGPAGEISLVPVEDEDREKAAEVLRRYDRNRDGQLDEGELKRGTFWGNPLDFDRNKDRKLSADELATRQSVRRNREEAQKSASNNDRDRRRGRDDSDEPVLEDFEGRRSYRVYAAPSAEGLPRFFNERDLNADGQVSMSEYTSDWTSSRIAEFYSWDGNGDGVITTAEAQSGSNRGLIASTAPRGVRPETNKPRTSGSSADTGPVEPSEKMIAYARNIIQRYDKDEDGALIETEWKSMLLSPAAADADGDGRLTVMEYAGYWEAKRKQ